MARFLPESCPRRVPDIIGHMAADELVLVLPIAGEVKVLNEVGAHIWDHIDGQRSVREIAATLCAVFEVEQAQAEADTLAFLEALAQRGMVTAA
jgi:hypothetical protein